MLSFLPTELVREIIESAVPHTFHTTTYKDRQRTLCSLSLVSNLLRSIAQPLLLELAQIQSNAQMDAVLATQDAMLPKELILDLRLDAQRSSRLLRQFTELTSFTCSRRSLGSPLDLNPLIDLPRLENLQVAGNSFVFSSPRQLASLRMLSLDQPSLIAVPTLLDRALVPALTALGLRWITAEPEDPQKTFIARLLPQLDALFVDIELYDVAKWTLFNNFASRILIEFQRWELKDYSQARDPACHLRIDAEADQEEDFRTIPEILKYLKSNEQTCLRSIYLDTSLRHVAYEPDLNELMEECRRREIELVFEAQPRGSHSDLYLSPEFCRRQRKERRRNESE